MFELIQDGKIIRTYDQLSRAKSALICAVAAEKQRIELRDAKTGKILITGTFERE